MKEQRCPSVHPALLSLIALFSLFSLIAASIVAGIYLLFN